MKPRPLGASAAAERAPASANRSDANRPGLAGHTWYRFRLYVADDTENSAQALANLTSLCQQHLSGCHEVEVVDVFRHPERARIDHIRMTPTLLKLEPAPVLRIVGTLGDTQQVLRALGLGSIAV